MRQPGSAKPTSLRVAALPTFTISFAASTVVRDKPKQAISAVEIAEQVATANWKQVASQRLSTYIGDLAYAAISSSWKTKHCKKLAEAARRLLALDSRAMTLGQASERYEVRRLIAGSGLALAFVDQVQSVHSPLNAVANSLRLSGIILCATHNCLGDCECLKDLAEGVGMPALRSAILSTCQGFLGM